MGGRLSRPELGRSGSAPTPGEPKVFALGSLGWQAFQDLCGTIMSSVLGQTVTAFRPTNDAGRDFAFEGDWAPVGGEALRGRFVVQAKFKSNGNFHRSDLAAELPKIRRLVRRHRCDSYVLMTNAGMTARSAEDIEEDVLAQGVQHVLLLGGDQLDRYIRGSSELRALVPRLYGLGDLTEILDDRRYGQARALLDSMREDISKFVITTPYRLAVRAMIDHGFVLLLGSPAAGKSMIASALAAASIDMWHCRPMKVEGPEAFMASWNAQDPSQFFWVDDAFGATQFQRQRADEWNQALGHLRAATGRGTRVVMTSRDYIWAEAGPALKLSVFPALESEQVVVDVHDLTMDDKRRILYNHLKYGNQPASFRTAVKPYLEGVAELPEFLPEVARRFGDPHFTQGLGPPWRLTVPPFFEHPLEHLKEVVVGLGRNEFAALASLFMAQGSRPSPIDLDPVEAGAVARLGSELAGVIAGLEALRGSLVVLGPDSEAPQRSMWSFKHPTISDAVQSVMADRPELLEIFLLGAPLESLVRQVSCGTVEARKALSVPDRSFGIVAARLKHAISRGQLMTEIAGFLANRCGPEFLASYGAELGSVTIDPRRPGADRIAARLAARGLLAEQVRHDIVAYHQENAIDQLDLEILTSGPLRSLMTPAEEEAFLERLHQEALRLDWLIDIERDNYDGEEAPDNVVERIRSILETLTETYPGDPDVTNAVSDVDIRLPRLQEQLAEEWHGDQYDDDSWHDRSYAVASADATIFSDVDE